MAKLEALKLVSIIMTAFNSQSTIERALISIFRQTYANLEIIVVDDHSNDATLSILQDFLLLDRRLRVFTTSVNYGPFVCKNFAMSQAKGDFFAFHDADDDSHPDYVLKSYELLVNNNAKATYVSGISYFPDDIKHEYSSGETFKRERVISITSFFSREVFNEVGFFDSVRFGADSEMRLRLVAYYGTGRDRVVIDSNLLTYYYMRRRDSLTCNPDTGIIGSRLTADRQKYFRNRSRFHKKIRRRNTGPYMEFPLLKRKIPISKHQEVGEVDLNNFKEIYG